MRRLVELDPVTFYTKEVDKVRLAREGRALKEYILSIPAAADKFDYRGRVLPIVEAALNDTLKLPLHASDEPLKYELREVLLPEDFEELFARFFNTAIGARAEVENPVTRDNKLFAWMDFEDESSGKQ